MGISDAFAYTQCGRPTRRRLIKAILATGVYSRWQLLYLINPTQAGRPKPQGASVVARITRDLVRTGHARVHTLPDRWHTKVFAAPSVFRRGRPAPQIEHGYFIACYRVWLYTTCLARQFRLEVVKWPAFMALFDWPVLNRRKPDLAALITTPYGRVLQLIEVQRASSATRTTVGKVRDYEADAETIQVKLGLLSVQCIFFVDYDPAAIARTLRDKDLGTHTYIAHLAELQRARTEPQALFDLELFHWAGASDERENPVALFAGGAGHE